MKNRRFSYCFDAVQRPVQPSDRTNEPEPVRPEKRPELFQLRPWTDPPLLVEPFGLTDPELNSPEILPPEMTNLSVALPQGVPTERTPMRHRNCHRRRLHHRFFATRGAALGFGFAAPRRLGLSTARGFSREPDSDFSSLPMLPPALPDCASAAPDMATEINSEREYSDRTLN